MPTKKTKQAVPAQKSTDSAELLLIRKLAEILNDTGLTDIELDHKGARVRVSKNITVAASVAAAPVAHVQTSAPPAVATPATAAPAATSDHPGTIKSPMVGTAYLAPSPGAPNFVAIGDTVKQGQTMLIIEAMKTMNQIAAPRAGRITAILIDNSQPVEFGEPLLVIE